MLEKIFDIIFVLGGLFIIFLILYSFGFLYFKDWKVIKDTKKIDYKDND